MAAATTESFKLMFGFLLSGLMSDAGVITTFQEQEHQIPQVKKTPDNIPSYLKITGLHPRNESVNEASYIFAFDAVGVIFQVVDDVGPNCDLLLGVGGGQVRVKLVQSSHVGVMTVLLDDGENCSSFY